MGAASLKTFCLSSGVVCDSNPGVCDGTFPLTYQALLSSGVEVYPVRAVYVIGGGKVYQAKSIGGLCSSLEPFVSYLSQGVVVLGRYTKPSLKGPIVCSGLDFCDDLCGCVESCYNSLKVVHYLVDVLISADVISADE